MEEELQSLIKVIKCNFLYNILMSDYIKIYKKNMTVKTVGNNVTETLMLLSEIGKENKEDEEDYGMEQEM
ncbi:hypothetical protein C1645_814722 [Glomus cerebriforme]|uniref:Uncharacterized protein n=1 Tax=Glomus cerebriforme TaxID=658196 RepID=A0A397TF61_9GLOM|nr:hypothetical protein C1645_814722 [Glomus cerebriforme]